MYFDVEYIVENENFFFDINIYCCIRRDENGKL